jgi:hypothetical protein
VDLLELKGLKEEQGLKVQLVLKEVWEHRDLQALKVSKELEESKAYKAYKEYKVVWVRKERLVLKALLVLRVRKVCKDA